ncbi:MAG: histone deacetylase family protein [Rhodovarius sp.]|nr:histone deacetylase family protein [Rhodovarius sp.]MDW8315632.1 histone deacetylase family protein [Rhodovarius sp.]
MAEARPPLLLLSHPDCAGHDMGPFAPERPARITAILSALDEPAFAGLRREEAPRATVEMLTRAHPPDYVSAILAIRPPPGQRVQLDPDTAMSAGSAEAALRAAGAAARAAEAVLKGEARAAFAATRPPGHHAEPARAMGFCLFANAVVAARHAQALGLARRVAILDFDVHHGNGTQACVERDASILFASTHQMPLYPGTGHAREVGVGNVINRPLPPGTDGAGFRAAWREILPRVADFAPDLVVVSAGFDAHRRDPLAQLELEAEDFGWITREIVALGRPVASLLEGGYDLAALAESVAEHLRALMG